MAPTTCWAAGAGPELGAQHADGGGAVPQLRHPRRCHGASGPGESAAWRARRSGSWAPAALGRVAGRALGAGTRPRPARERAVPQSGLSPGLPGSASNRAAFRISRTVMKWKVFLKRPKLSVLEAEVVNDVVRVGHRAGATRRRGPAARTWIGARGGGVRSLRVRAPGGHPAVAGVGGAVAASCSPGD